MQTYTSMGPSIVLPFAVVLVALSPLAQAGCDYGGAIKRYQKMMNVSLAWASGCCPKIVVPGPAGSVIENYPGFKGNAAIIVDYGSCSAQPTGGFLWYVDWGDGSFGYQRTATLGPFQATHHYPSAPGVFPVFAFYCSAPPPPYEPCCDVLSQDINVIV